MVAWQDILNYSLTNLVVLGSFPLWVSLAIQALVLFMYAWLAPILTNPGILPSRSLLNKNNALPGSSSRTARNWPFGQVQLAERTANLFFCRMV